MSSIPTEPQESPRAQEQAAPREEHNLRNILLALFFIGMIGLTYFWAYSNGFNSGYSRGNSAGLISGYLNGYDYGNASGYNTGYNRGYDKGHDAGRFEFYYEKPTQKYGVNELDNYVNSKTWTLPYQEGVFDCSEMSACLERDLENEGFHTVIVIGNSPSGSGRHAWLLVETSVGGYMPVEATSRQVVWWNSPYFDNCFKYELKFETIQEALAYNPTEFDWWNSA